MIQIPRRSRADNRYIDSDATKMGHRLLDVARHLNELVRRLCFDYKTSRLRISISNNIISHFAMI